MTDRVDVFRIENPGVVRWLESAPSVECAAARVQELAVDSPGEYLVLDHGTGNKFEIKLDCNGTAPPNLGLSKSRGGVTCAGLPSGLCEQATRPNQSAQVLGNFPY